MTDYQPGSFFVVEVTGLAGAAIYFGQFLAQAQSVYGHAGVIVDEDGTTVEAAPGGAFVGNVSAYKGRALLISDAPVRERVARSLWKSSRQVDIEATIRGLVVREARRLAPHDGEPGVGYSALDYLALALLHLHLPSRWVRRRVESSGHMQCAQLIDAVYERAGIHLFDDGRLPGDVMPSDLAAWAEDHA